MRFKHIILIIVIFLLLVSCKGYKLESDWRDREIKIDGDDREWDETRFHIEKEGVVVGVMNDEEFLYLCLYTQENSLSKKILRQGLTLWLNSEGKSDKNLGIRYPQPKHPVDVREDLKKDINAEPNLKDFMLGDIKIIGPDNKVTNRLKPKQLTGLKLALKIDKGTLIYELKIPLKYEPGYSLFLDADPGSTVSLGFEIKEIKLGFPEMKPEKKGSPGDMPRGEPGVRDGSGKAVPGMGEQRPSGGTWTDTSAQEFWLKINLAEK